MAASVLYTAQKITKRGRIIKWGPFGASDTFNAVECAGFQDKTVYFVKGSAFGGNVGCQITPMVSTDPTTAVWVTPTDINGNAISGKTTDGAFLITEGAGQFQPTTASGVTAVYCYLVLNAPSDSQTG